MSTDDWLAFGAVVLGGLTQVAVLMVLLWAVYQTMQREDYPTAAICALVFLALSADFRDDSRKRRQP